MLDLRFPQVQRIDATRRPDSSGEREHSTVHEGVNNTRLRRPRDSGSGSFGPIAQLEFSEHEGSLKDTNHFQSSLYSRVGAGPA